MAAGDGLPVFKNKLNQPMAITPVAIIDTNGVHVNPGGGTGGAGDASAANQLDEINRLTAIRDAAGATNDAPYASLDASTAGTIVSILKGLYVLFARAFGYLPAGVDRSGTVNTVGTGTLVGGTTGFSVPAKNNRYILQGQNVSNATIGYNEMGGTAAIGSPGTYTVPPLQSFNISTKNQINFVVASGTAAVTMTEI